MAESDTSPAPDPAPIPLYLPAYQPHFLSGPPAGGKTAFIAGLIRQLKSGADVFGKPSTAPPFIGVVSADRTWQDSRRWYDVAGLPDLPSFSLVDSDIPLTTLRRGDPLAVLERALDEFAAPPDSLLIVDPISYWCGGDMNRYMQVYVAMIGLNRFCLRRKVTIIGLAHTGKQKGDVKERYTRPQDRINGSAALLGCSGTQMALETPDQVEQDSKTAFYRFTWVPHHAPAESYLLERDEVTGLFIQPDAELGSEGDQNRALRGEVLKLLPVHPDAPVTPKQILKLANTAHVLVSRATLFRLLKLWQDASLLVQPSPGFYVRPPLQ